jgi:hypothetical protein
MSVHLADLSAGHHSHHPPAEKKTSGGAGGRRRAWTWLGGLALAAAIYLGFEGFWNWKHVISSSGGRYFVRRVEIPVPAFQQNDPRWSLDLLGPTFDTVGQQGCALTSAAMVLASYGIDTDPQRLNAFLDTNGGYTPNGWLYWEKAAALAPGRVEKAYEDLPSYALIDANLLAGNPVIIRLTLRNGTTHFVVIVGKQGWDYLTRDPARPPDWGVYPLRELTSRIEALRFYRELSPPPAISVPPLTVPPPGTVPPAGKVVAAPTLPDQAPPPASAGTSAGLH